MKQICIFGLGQFGNHLARTLVKMDCEVLVVDLNESRIDDVRDSVHRAIIGDARDYQMIRTVVSPDVDEGIVCLGEQNIEPSILCTLHLKRLGVRLIRSTARNDEHASILRAVGASEIIFPERETAQRIARQISTPVLRDMFPLSEDYRIMDVVAPAKLHGKTLAAVDLRRRFDIMIIAARAKGETKFNFLPSADKVILPEEVLMVLGRELDLVRFAEM